MAKYYTDGFCFKKNPSNIGGGYIITDEKGEEICRCEINKNNFTNNEAEISGIWECLKIAHKNDIISSDSMCAIGWVNKGKSKARPDLDRILKECKDLKEARKINLMWEAREFNKAGLLLDEEKTAKPRK